MRVVVALASAAVALLIWFTTMRNPAPQIASGAGGRRRSQQVPLASGGAALAPPPAPARCNPDHAPPPALLSVQWQPRELAWTALSFFSGSYLWQQYASYKQRQQRSEQPAAQACKGSDPADSASEAEGQLARRRGRA